MQGLLDFMKTPEGQGLLSMVAGGLAVAGQPGRGRLNTLGAAGLAGLQGYAGAQDRQEQAAQNKQMMDYRGAQMKALEAQLAQQQRAQKAIQEAFQPVQPIDANAASGITGPRLEALSAVGQLPKVDYQKLVAQGVPIETVKALAEAPNLGRQKVARTVKGVGPDGREYEYQVDDYGQRVGDGLAQYRAPIQVNQGNKTTFADPYSLKQVGSFQTFQSPDSAASNALGWANHRLSGERLSFDKSQVGKPQFHDGAWVLPPNAQNPQGVAIPVPGMPQKPLTEGQAKANLFGTRAQEAQKTLEEMAGKGTDRPGWLKRTTESTVGILPSWAGRDGLVDGAGALTNWTQSGAQQQVEQAQRNFINAILRRESGAAIAESEFSNAAKQYFPQVGDSDAVIKQKAKNRQTAIEGLQAEVPGGLRKGQSSQQPAAPKPLEVVDGYTFLGGDPSDPARWKKAGGKK